MVLPRAKIVILLLALSFVGYGCGGHRPTAKAKPERKVAKVKKKGKERRYAKVAPGTFVWPVEGPVNSPYGPRWGRQHDGIDIGGESGEPILASAAGEVVYSARLGGYGNLVVVQHPDGFFTAYAHNKKNLVDKGDRVKQGQLIAKMGRTGSATGDHLHFEIRDTRGTYNPEAMLSEKDYARKKPVKILPPPTLLAGKNSDFVVQETEIDAPSEALLRQAVENLKKENEPKELQITEQSRTPNDPLFDL